MNEWQLYDTLIKGIPEALTVSCCNIGYRWVSLVSSEDGMGVAKTIPVESVPFAFQEEISGAPLKQIASLSKSWNFIEAALGVAAIGAYYNHPSRAIDCGLPHPGANESNTNVFDLYAGEVKDLKVTVVGHFPSLEKKYGPICGLTILERDPQRGDLPDSACEYILCEQDYVFITGCTLVNKTLPRLLELSRNAKVIIAGPSTILSPVMFDYGVYGLSGVTIQDPLRCDAVLRESGATPGMFEVSDMQNRVRPSGKFSAPLGRTD